MADEKEKMAEEHNQPPEEEKKPLFTKKFFLVTLVPMWSFFLFFFLFYYFSISDYKQQWLDLVKKYEKQNEKKPLALPDTLVSEPMTITVGSAQWDSLFFNELLTQDDKLRILNIENTRRQKEIDFLYEQLVNQKEYIERLEQTLRSLSPENTVTLLLEKFPQLAMAPPEEPDTVKVIEQPEPVSNNPYSTQAIKSSAKIYEAMRPDVAAQILSNIDEEVAASILTHTNQRKAAKILESMEKSKATALSQRMVGKS